jgi:hypothetical protein
MTTTAERPAIRAGDGVTLFVSDCPDPAFGVVTRVYLNVIGVEVAEIELPHRTALQCTEFLSLVRPAVTA